MTFLYIALGGALGCTARYALTRFIGQFSPASFPYGTWVTNLLGCLFIGFLGAVIVRNHLPSQLRLLLITGFCGGFTTFSTFAYESLHLLRTGAWLSFVIYATLSLWMGIAGVWLGEKLGEIS